MNKTKVILFDVDGLLIRLPYYFGAVLAKQGYKNAEKVLDSYFHSDAHRHCLEGKADMAKSIAPSLKKFGWKGTAKEFQSKRFKFESAYLQKDIVSIVRRLRKAGISCFLCTDQEKNRAEFILNEMDFKNIFDGYFISCFIGYRKCHNNFWKQVLKELKKEFSDIRPDEVVFFDDKRNNINVALKFGIKALSFKNKGQFKKDVALLK